MDEPKLTAKTIPFKQYVMRAPVSGPLPGEFSDWPAKIQEPILEAYEKADTASDLPLRIIASKCENVDGQWFLVVVAQQFPPAVVN